MFAAIWHEFGTVEGCSAGCSPLPYRNGIKANPAVRVLMQVVPSTTLNSAPKSNCAAVANLCWSLFVLNRF
jgi:hypothetical protein